MATREREQWRFVGRVYTIGARVIRGPAALLSFPCFGGLPTQADRGSRCGDPQLCAARYEVPGALHSRALLHVGEPGEV